MNFELDILEMVRNIFCKVFGLFNTGHVLKMSDIFYIFERPLTHDPPGWFSPVIGQFFKIFYQYD